MKPSWGVLAHESIEQIEAVIQSLEHLFDLSRFEFKTNAGWTAAFYMEPSPTSELDGAEALRGTGVEVAQLDFDRDGFRVSRWNGHEWEWTGEDPITLCAEVGIGVPGHPPPHPRQRPFRPTRTRAVSLVESMTADQVRSALGDSDLPETIEDAARGALVTEHPLWVDGPTYAHLSSCVPNRVYHVEYDPLDGRFVCLSLRDGVVEERFEVGDTWVRRSGIRVDEIEGESTPEGIVRKLGIPDSFLA